MAILTAAGFFLAPSLLPGEQRLTVPDMTVGRNLETDAAIRLAEAAPEAGVQLTLTSDDPTKLLLSDTPVKAGKGTIVLTVARGASQSPSFCVQGLVDIGKVTYTVTAPGAGSAKGTVTLTPSAIVIVGPFKTPSFTTTPRGLARKIMLVSAMLDSAGKPTEQQIAGGLKMDLKITNSNPDVGKLGYTSLTLSGGDSQAATNFTPAGLGSTTLAPSQPPGFSTPAEHAAVVVVVEQPGLAPPGDVYVGKDLQIKAVLVMGEPAPPGGLKVALKSDDGTKLVLSDKPDQLGSSSLTLDVPEGQATAGFFLQGLSDSGVVTYQATAPGYRGRDAKVGLAPSGVIVGWEKMGPPDHAAVSRKIAPRDDRGFWVSLSDPKATAWHMVVWTAYLDPEVGRAADITLEPLRPGVTVTVDLKSSNPAVGTIESPVKIKSGESWTTSLFTPLSKGETMISVITPPGFTKSQNATSIRGNVDQ